RNRLALSGGVTRSSTKSPLPPSSDGERPPPPLQPARHSRRDASAKPFRVFVEFIFVSMQGAPTVRRPASGRGPRTQAAGPHAARVQAVRGWKSMWGREIAPTSTSFVAPGSRACREVYRAGTADHSDLVAGGR